MLFESKYVGLYCKNENASPITTHKLLCVDREIGRVYANTLGMRMRHSSQLTTYYT